MIQGHTYGGVKIFMSCTGVGHTYDV